MKTAIRIAVSIALLTAMSGVAQARIKLTTVPERETVRIDIQNGRFTLVEEERTVNLQSGRNEVDFSWANINIDKDSIVFRVIKADGEVNVLNTNYPPNENALYWTVSAEKAGPAVIRISYLIANMQAEPSYQGIVENDEKQLLMQVYMTVTNTSGESFGETVVQPGVGKTVVRYFQDGERKRMLAAKFAEVPIQKRYVFDSQVDQERTRMYYRLTNDKANHLGGFPLPHGKVRLFIKESGGGAKTPATEEAATPKNQDAEAKGKGQDTAKEEAGDDEIRSQAFLGEDWAQYTPLFAPMDLYVGVAQDVKVERFQMQPEEGPQKAVEEVTCPRFTIDGKETVTKPQFQHQRTRFRYRLQNFKTEKGDPITVPLTVKEHVDGEWILEKVVLKEILGERNATQEKEIPLGDMFTPKRIDVGNVEFEIKLPPTTVDKKYDLYVTILRKFRRSVPPVPAPVPQ